MPDIRLGNTVTTTENTKGVVTDIDRAYESALVQLTDGPQLDDLDRSHGRWYGYDEIIAITGHDPAALVWRGSRMTPVGE
jgi:hypothetical protein